MPLYLGARESVEIDHNAVALPRPSCFGHGINEFFGVSDIAQFTPHIGVQSGICGLFSDLIPALVRHGDTTNSQS
jgi:hypothetical protein